MAGVGIDLVDVRRFQKALSAHKRRFFETTFSARERAYCDQYKDSAVHYAGLFAAKEAFRKASGTLNMPFSDMEVYHSKEGRPLVYVKQVKHKTCSISITHTKNYASAIALCR